MSRLRTAQARQTTVHVTFSDTETSEIILRDLKDCYGNEIEMTDLGDIGYLTFGPGTSKEEIVSFTDYTINADGTVSIDTGITRACGAVYPYTGGAGTANQHSAGDLVVLSNNPQIYESILLYIDGIAVAGAPNASSTGKGIVELATAAEIDSDTATGSTGAPIVVTPDQLILSKYGLRLLSSGQKDALAGGSTFGTPSTTNKFITQEYNSSATGLPVILNKTTVATNRGSSTTQFDVTNPAGTTFTYTWDSNGTDPNISAATMPVGSIVYISGSNLSAGNRGIFVVTASGTNNFSVTNASGVAETNKKLGTGHLLTTSAADGTYTKPAGLKYIEVELQASGGSGAGGTNNTKGGNGGGGGGYLKKLIPAASLGANEYFVVAPSVAGGASTANGNTGCPTVFTSSLIALGGEFGTAATNPGLGGIATGGDVNIPGKPGGTGGTDNYGGGSSPTQFSGYGGDSHLGSGGMAQTTAGTGNAGINYGGGGGGAFNSGNAGGASAQGKLTITEHYS